MRLFNHALTFQYSTKQRRPHNTALTSLDDHNLHFSKKGLSFYFSFVSVLNKRSSNVQIRFFPPRPICFLRQSHDLCKWTYDINESPASLIIIRLFEIGFSSSQLKTYRAPTLDCHVVPILTSSHLKMLRSI